MHTILRCLTTTLIALFVFNNVYFGQIPAGYYDDAQGLRGEELREALFQIIKDHTSLTYRELWSAFVYTDKKPNGKVWDMYSDNPGGTPPYEYTFIEDQCGNYGGEAYCYNREHSFPKSWFNDASPMYTDLFHLYPTDGYVNGRRSNYPYGEVRTADWTSRNGSKLGRSSYSGYTGTVFEPIDEYKGDFARTYFYMLTCYKDKISRWDSDMLSADNFSEWARKMLLEWHRNDPVSEKEINRNNAVYGYQNNRNPFIDDPDFADKIWDPGFVATPYLRIISPSDGEIVYNSELEVVFVISDFDPGTDGKVEYKLNSALIGYTTSSPVIISGLAEDSNIISLQLVDNNNDPLDPAVLSQVSVIYNTVSNIVSDSDDQQFSIYPNPVYDFFEISLSNNNIKVESVYVTDLTGKVNFYKENVDINYPINVEGMESGMYFISVRLANGEMYSQKFIIFR